MSKKNQITLRTQTARILSDVVKQQIPLPNALKAHGHELTKEDQASAQFISYGVLREYYTYEKMLGSLLQKPLQPKEHLLKHLLMSGLFQLHDSKMKAHAIVNESVNAASALRKVWAKSLVNAVLRKAQSIEKSNFLTSNHPDWLITRLKEDYPQNWQQILTANSKAPPMTLRVNQSKSATDTYQAKLLPLESTPGKYAPSSLTLTKAQPVSLLPGFSEGEVSVQDQAGQLLPYLLNLNENATVLDACAAPGSKACHCLEVEPSLKLTATDIDESRLQKLTENIKRLKLNLTTHVLDATLASDEFPDESFDVVLLDAPCSATGVIRRHPDINFLRLASDIQALHETQVKLLKSLWPLVKPGGQLLYSTCSVLSEENEEVISECVNGLNNCKHRTIEANWGMMKTYGRQILPGEDNMDGFYYALLEKTQGHGQ